MSDCSEQALQKVTLFGIELRTYFKYIHLKIFDFEGRKLFRNTQLYQMYPKYPNVPKFIQIYAYVS